MDVTEFRNPVVEPLQELHWLETFSGYSPDSRSEIRLKWMFLLLLPVGIGLRALKTSIELFASPV